MDVEQNERHYGTIDQINLILLDVLMKLEYEVMDEILKNSNLSDDEIKNLLLIVKNLSDEISNRITIITNKS